jgi:hypothetical protein
MLGAGVKTRSSNIRKKQKKAEEGKRDRQGGIRKRKHIHLTHEAVHTDLDRQRGWELEKCGWI